MAEKHPEKCVSEAQARVVIFPQVGDSADTVVQSLGPSECLDELMRSVPARGLPALIKDQKALEVLFDLLASLSATTSTYRVRLGTEAAGVIETLSGLI